MFLKKKTTSLEKLEQDENNNKHQQKKKVKHIKLGNKNKSEHKKEEKEDDDIMVDEVDVALLEKEEELGEELTNKEELRTIIQKDLQIKKKIRNDNLTNLLFGGSKNLSSSFNSSSSNNNNDNKRNENIKKELLLLEDFKLPNKFSKQLKRDISTVADDELFVIDKPINRKIEEEEHHEEEDNEQQLVEQQDDEDENKASLLRMEDDESMNNTKPKVIRIKPAWSDIYTKELRISSGVDDNEEEEEEDNAIVNHDELSGNIIKSYLKRGREHVIISGEEYEKKMRKIYLQLNPTPLWAKLKIKQIEVNTINNEETGLVLKEEIINNLEKNQIDEKFKRNASKSLLDTTLSTVLDRFTLKYEVLTDLNAKEKMGSVLSISFHPKVNVCAVLSNDKTIRLFTVDGKVNPLMDRLIVKDHRNNKKFNKILFTKDGKSIIILLEKLSRFLMTDLQTGKTRESQDLFVKRKKIEEREGGKYILDNVIDLSNDNKLIALSDDIGNVIIMSRSTLTVKFMFTSNIKEVNNLTFSYDSKYLFVTGKGSKIFIYDIENEKPKYSFNDFGNSEISTLALSNDMQYIATGSKSGMVNIYRWNDVWSTINPKPLTVLTNLTTNVDILKFNVDTQLLLMASSEKCNAFRLVHIPSFSVYSNFPGDIAKKKELQFKDIDFDSTSKMLALGGNSGSVLLYGFPFYMK
ncbi:hypothetical protein ABK040_006127 [Willaertia magna]